MQSLTQPNLLNLIESPAVHGFLVNCLLENALKSSTVIVMHVLKSVTWVDGRVIY